jgi:chaperonin cofactor prefoldin
MVVDPLTNMEVDEEIDIMIVDPDKLDAEAKKVAKATQLAEEAENADKKLGRLSGIFQSRDPDKKLFGLFEDKEAIKDRISKLENKMDKTEDIINQFQPWAADPVGTFIQAGSRKLGPITKLAGVIMALTVTYKAIVAMVSSLFQPGSVFDIRKKVLEAAKSIPELNYLINIRNGNVFFTADTSISQTAPTTSNTERMRDSHMRFNYFYLGDSLGDVV